MGPEKTSLLRHDEQTLGEQARLGNTPCGVWGVSGCAANAAPISTQGARHALRKTPHQEKTPDARQNFSEQISPSFSNKNLKIKNKYNLYTHRKY